MCIHNERDLRKILAREPHLSAVIQRSGSGRFLAAWLTNPRSQRAVAYTIRALTEWHPRANAVIDLDDVNRKRQKLGIPVLDLFGLPVYEGYVERSSEETVIGKRLKNTLARISRESRQGAVAA